MLIFVNHHQSCLPHKFCFLHHSSLPSSRAWFQHGVHKILQSSHSGNPNSRGQWCLLRYSLVAALTNSGFSLIIVSSFVMPLPPIFFFPVRTIWAVDYINILVSAVYALLQCITCCILIPTASRAFKTVHSSSSFE